MNLLDIIVAILLPEQERLLTIQSLSLLLLRRLSVGNWLVITLLTIRSMGQFLARVWMPAIHVQESGIRHHRRIVVPRRTWLGIEEREVVADSEYDKRESMMAPFSYLNKSLISQSIASATLVR
nr:MAG TPA: hypothetical protein [Caudoviricetes sp.]